MRSKSSMLHSTPAAWAMARKVQHGIGRAARGHDHGDRSRWTFVTMSRGLMSRRMASISTLADSRAEFISVVRVGHGAGIGQAHAQRLERAAHGVGGVHAAAEPVPGWRCSMSLQFLVAHLARAFSPTASNTLTMFRSQPLQQPAGWCRHTHRCWARWRAACPSAAGHVLVAAANHQHAVHPLAPTQVSTQSAITSRLTRLYFMPSVPMAMPSLMVGVPKIWALPPASSYAGHRRVGQLFAAAVARRDGAVAVGHADHGLVEIGLP